MKKERQTLYTLNQRELHEAITDWVAKNEKSMGTVKSVQVTYRPRDGHGAVVTTVEDVKD